MPSHKDAWSTGKSEGSDFCLSRTRAKLRRTTQKFRRTMMTTADWPPPRVIFNSEMSTSADEGDVDNQSSLWLFSCCFQRRRSRSPESEDYKKSNLSQMLMGTYKNGNQAKGKKLMLRTGDDGSLICADHVDMNMLIEGFREFERRFQYGTLMPFANVLPSANSIRTDPSQEEIPKGEEEAEKEQSTISQRSNENRDEVFQGNHKKLIVVESICEA
ncbi:hypothetical protein Aperf_G00000112501 [Anoplocephala perfoliata]